MEKWTGNQNVFGKINLEGGNASWHALREISMTMLQVEEKWLQFEHRNTKRNREYVLN